MNLFSEKDTNKLNDIFFILSNQDLNNCESCLNFKFYLNKFNVKICMKCKKKYSVYHNTILENVRFDKLKAINILIEYHNSKNKLNSIYISKKYKITQKTAYNFYLKLKQNQDKVYSFIEINKENKKTIDTLKKITYFKLKKI